MSVVTSDSKLLSYEIIGEGNLLFEWEMNLPKSIGYSLFTDQGNIYVIPEDGKKEITYVKSPSFHRTIKKSKFPTTFYIDILVQKPFYGCTTARVGYMIFYICFETVCGFMRIKGPFVWVMNKKKWIDGPQMFNDFNSLDIQNSILIWTF